LIPVSLSKKTNEGGAPTVGGAFKTIIKELKPSTKYYVRAYATTSQGATGYGNEVSFTTPAAGFVFCIVSRYLIFVNKIFSLLDSDSRFCADEKLLSNKNEVNTNRL
jgi:hypothetical protein